jgi:hypothetical protein
MGGIEDKKLEQLWDLVQEVLYASTKESAKGPLKKLEFQASILSDSLSPYARGKLREVISYSKTASGQVRDKVHWERQLKQAWYVFKNQANRKPVSSDCESGVSNVP